MTMLINKSFNLKYKFHKNIINCETTDNFIFTEMPICLDTFIKTIFRSDFIIAEKKGKVAIPQSGFNSLMER